MSSFGGGGVGETPNVERLSAVLHALGCTRRALLTSRGKVTPARSTQRFNPATKDVL